MTFTSDRQLIERHRFRIRVLRRNHKIITVIIAVNGKNVRPVIDRESNIIHFTVDDIVGCLGIIVQVQLLNLGADYVDRLSKVDRKITNPASSQVLNGNVIPPRSGINGNALDTISREGFPVYGYSNARTCAFSDSNLIVIGGCGYSYVVGFTATMTGIHYRARIGKVEAYQIATCSGINGVLTTATNNDVVTGSTKNSVVSRSSRYLIVAVFATNDGARRAAIEDNIIPRSAINKCGVVASGKNKVITTFTKYGYGTSTFE